MLLPYYSDECVEFRPWMAYVCFPLNVIASFYLAGQGTVPEFRRMYFINLVDIAGLVLLVEMIVSFFFLWTMGRAICSKLGNFIYLTLLFITVGIGMGFYRGMEYMDSGDNTIWLLSWTTHFFAGMFLIYFPLNSVDFFIVFPPFRTVTISGLTAVILWLAADFLFCICLGWGKAVFFHPLSFLMGSVTATILLKIPSIAGDDGDRTLWQWLRGEGPEDLAWKDSWSEKKKKKNSEDLKLLQTDMLLEQKEKEVKDCLSGGQITKVLCQCGNVMHATVSGEIKQIKCDVCSRDVKIPN